MILVKAHFLYAIALAQPQGRLPSRTSSVKLAT